MANIICFWRHYHFEYITLENSDKATYNKKELLGSFIWDPSIIRKACFNNTCNFDLTQMNLLYQN